MLRHVHALSQYCATWLIKGNGKLNNEKNTVFTHSLGDSSVAVELNTEHKTTPHHFGSIPNHLTKPILHNSLSCSTKIHFNLVRRLSDSKEIICHSIALLTVITTSGDTLLPLMRQTITAL
jgi:hypothetical protein